MIASFTNLFMQVPLYPLYRIETILQTQNAYLPPEKRYQNAFDLIKRLPKEEKQGCYESSHRGFFPHVLSGILGHANIFAPIYLIAGIALPILRVTLLPAIIVYGHRYQLASLKLQADIGTPVERKYSTTEDCLQKIEEVDGPSVRNRGIGYALPLLFTEAYNVYILSEFLRKHSKRILMKSLGLQILTYPLDVIRKRYMIESGNKEKRYNGYVDCFSQIVQEEGWQALFSGLEVKLTRDFLLYGIPYAYWFLRHIR